MIQDLSIMKKGVDPSVKYEQLEVLLSLTSCHLHRYAAYNDDVAVELAEAAHSKSGSVDGAGDDDADDSFDLKNYDITYNEELAGSSSDDDAPKDKAGSAVRAAAAAAGSTPSGSSNITDHLGRAQKKTLDMCCPHLSLASHAQLFLMRYIQVVVSSAAARPRR
jgi:hypothetical protein